MRYPTSWSELCGEDLALFDHQWDSDFRLVGCLNVWNDFDELSANMWTWAPYCDHVIAMDGAYDGVPCDDPNSTDGTIGLLNDINAEIVGPPGGKPWVEQCTKKSTFFDLTGPGDVLLLVDADETYEDVESIRTMPYFDVGWLKYSSPIYIRCQHIPRLVRWRPDMYFKDRHHHIYAGDKQICTNQRGGTGLVHRQSDATFDNSRGFRRQRERVWASQVHRHEQVQQEAENEPGLPAYGHEPLQVLQLGPFDPGAVMFRLHTAINTTSAGTSVMATGAIAPGSGEETQQVPRQFNADEDADTVRRLAEDADVVHYHVTRYGDHLVNNRVPRVAHHHGTVYRTEPDVWNERDKDCVLRLVSNLELLQYGGDLHYLPNPVPVQEYKKLGRGYEKPGHPDWQKGVLRVAHSPTKRHNKGTEAFFDAVDRCNEMGIKVIMHLIEHASISASIRAKSQCHAVFDSFWLGMQCSGLEGAAIGLPVLAGDQHVKTEYEKAYGYCPYTFADDASDLVEMLCALATDEDFYHAEATRVHDHVATYHDPAVVAAQYLDLLDTAVEWRDNLMLGRPGTLWRR